MGLGLYASGVRGSTPPSGFWPEPRGLLKVMVAWQVVLVWPIGGPIRGQSSGFRYPLVHARTLSSCASPSTTPGIVCTSSLSFPKTLEIADEAVFTKNVHHPLTKSSLPRTETLNLQGLSTYRWSYCKKLVLPLEVRQPEWKGGMERFWQICPFFDFAPLRQFTLYDGNTPTPQGAAPVDGHVLK